MVRGSQAASRKSPVAKAAVDVAHRHARLRQSTHLPRGSPSVLTAPSPVGIAENQTARGRFLHFWLLSPKCKALTDKGKRSNKDWGHNVAKRRNKLSPPFQRRGTVWGTGAAKRQQRIIAGGEGRGFCGPNPRTKAEKAMRRDSGARRTWRVGVPSAILRALARARRVFTLVPGVAGRKKQRPSTPG